MLVVSLMFLGMWSCQSEPQRGTQPSCTVARVVVQWSGKSSVEMDKLVAYPLITSLDGLPYVIDVHSLSYSERADIYVVLEHNAGVNQLKGRLMDLASLVPVEARIKVDQLRPEEEIPAPEPCQRKQFQLEYRSCRSSDNRHRLRMFLRPVGYA